MEEEAYDKVDNPVFVGMTYEEGVLTALEWVLGEHEEDGIFGIEE